MENRIEQEKNITLLVINELRDEYLRDILFLEEKCFPKEWQYDDANEYYRKILRDRENINIFLQEEEKMIGYVLARLHDREVDELLKYDPEFKKQANVYYIETIQVLPEKQGLGGSRKLLAAACEEAKKRGITKFSIHARKTNGFNETVKKIFTGKIILTREIESWEPAQGEPYEYVEWEC